MTVERPEAASRVEAFSGLRKQSHMQIERETTERIKTNPKPSFALFS